MKPSGIGGQAVLEGIMMKNQDKYSVAVRKPNKEIEVSVQEYESLVKNKRIISLPFIRGVFNFIDSMVLGVKSLTYSASFYEEEEPVEEEPAFDRAVNKMFGEKAEDILMGITVAFSVIISVALFMVLPFFVTDQIQKHTSLESHLAFNAIEGAIRVTLFVLYIFLISRMEDIKRTFMYHGAEHKCINCIENGYELTVGNVKINSRYHKRCGTSFMFIVMIISILFFMFIKVDNRVLKIVFRLCLVPVIAGVSYEFIRLAGRSESKLVHILSKPGMWMQKLTTREPDDDMIEVAIRAIEAVFDWEKYQAGEKDTSVEEGKEIGTTTVQKETKQEKAQEQLEKSAQAIREKTNLINLDEQPEEELEILFEEDENEIH